MTAINIVARYLLIQQNLQVTSNRLDPNRNNLSCALGRTASAQTLNETKASPIGWNDGVNVQSAAANKTNPKHIQNAQKYSTEENIFLCTIDATIIVGINLHDRKTTFVGKLI